MVGGLAKGGDEMRKMMMICGLVLVVLVLSAVPVYAGGGQVCVKEHAENTAEERPGAFPVGAVG